MTTTKEPPALDVTLTAPNGSMIRGILDTTETVHNSTFVLEETPDGPRIRHGEIHDSETFIEDARAATHNGKPLFLGEDGETYTLDDLTMEDLDGNELPTPQYRLLARPHDLRWYLQTLTRTLADLSIDTIDLHSFSLASFLTNGMPPEQAIPLAERVRIQDGACILRLENATVPWPAVQPNAGS